MPYFIIKVVFTKNMLKQNPIGFYFIPIVIALVSHVLAYTDSMQVIITNTPQFYYSHNCELTISVISSSFLQYNPQNSESFLIKIMESYENVHFLPYFKPPSIYTNSSVLIQQYTLDNCNRGILTNNFTCVFITSNRIVSPDAKLYYNATHSMYKFMVNSIVCPTRDVDPAKYHLKIQIQVPVSAGSAVIRMAGNYTHRFVGLKYRVIQNVIANPLLTTNGQTVFQNRTQVQGKYYLVGVASKLSITLEIANQTQVNSWQTLKILFTQAPKSVSINITTCKLTTSQQIITGNLSNFFKVISSISIPCSYSSTTNSLAFTNPKYTPSLFVYNQAFNVYGLYRLPASRLNFSVDVTFTEVGSASFRYQVVSDTGKMINDQGKLINITTQTAILYENNRQTETIYGLNQPQYEGINQKYRVYCKYKPSINNTTKNITTNTTTTNKTNNTNNNIINNNTNNINNTNSMSNNNSSIAETNITNTSSTTNTTSNINNSSTKNSNTSINTNRTTIINTNNTITNKTNNTNNTNNTNSSRNGTSTTNNTIGKNTTNTNNTNLNTTNTTYTNITTSNNIKNNSTTSTNTSNISNTNNTNNINNANTTNISNTSTATDNNTSSPINSSDTNTNNNNSINSNTTIIPTITTIPNLNSFIVVGSILLAAMLTACIRKLPYRWQKYLFLIFILSDLILKIVLLVILNNLPDQAAVQANKEVSFVLSIFIVVQYLGFGTVLFLTYFAYILHNRHKLTNNIFDQNSSPNSILFLLFAILFNYKFYCICLFNIKLASKFKVKQFKNKQLYIKYCWHLFIEILLILLQIFCVVNSCSYLSISLVFGIHQGVFILLMALIGKTVYRSMGASNAKSKIRSVCRSGNQKNSKVMRDMQEQDKKFEQLQIQSKMRQMMKSNTLPTERPFIPRCNQS